MSRSSLPVFFRPSFEGGGHSRIAAIVSFSVCRSARFSVHYLRPNAAPARTEVESSTAGVFIGIFNLVLTALVSLCPPMFERLNPVQSLPAISPVRNSLAGLLPMAAGASPKKGRLRDLITRPRLSSDDRIYYMCNRLAAL